MSNSFVSKTDKGLVIDVVVPGYGKDDVKVQTFVEKCGDCNGAVDYIRVVGKYARNTGDKGLNVPRFGFEKVVTEKFKEVFELDQKYDKAKLVWGWKNGVVRIRVGLQDWAIGTDVTAVANVEAGADTETE